MKPSSCGHGFGVERQGRAREGARAERRDRGPRVPVAEAVDVAGKGVHVLGELVAERDRLGVLEMGEAGRRRPGVAFGLVEQRPLEVDDLGHDGPRVVTQVEPEVGGHLVVAAAAGTELAARRTQPGDEFAFDRGVHVLVVGMGYDVTPRDRRRQVAESGDDLGQLAVAEQTRAVEDAGMRGGLPDVVRREPPVELHRP